MRTALAVTVIALAACRGEPRSALVTPAAPVAVALAAPAAPARDTGRDSLKDSAAAAAAAAKKPVHPLLTDTGIVRALYVNRWAAQSARRMRELIAIADSTEINALVIDMKDEFGLNYASRDTMVSRNAGKAGKVAKLAALLDTLKAHGILPIARVVVFKDSVAARVNPQHVIRKPDGTPWRDKKGLTWVDPYDRMIWDYNIRVAEELAAMGFGEIQFDYIRFPEPYKSLPPQVFKDANGVPKPKALAEYFKAACPRVHAQGARCTADIFGLVTSLHEALEVGQQWSELAPVTDVLLPMVYPSHYPKGSFGVAHPNGAPYTIVDSAISDARRQDRRLGITNPIHVRAWLQAFTLGKPKYTAEEVLAQKKGVYDAGYDSWTLWSPGSEYLQFIPALERSTVSRKKVVGIGKN